MKYFMKYRIEICSSIFILFLLTVVTIVSFVMNYGGLQDILYLLWMGFAVFYSQIFLIICEGGKKCWIASVSFWKDRMRK